MSIDSIVKPIGDAAGALGGAIGNIGSAFTTIQGLTGSGSRQANRYINLAGDAASAQADIARDQANLAREQWRNYKENFLPYEKAQAAEAARDLSMFRPLKQAVVTEGLAGLKRIAPLEQKLFQEAMDGSTPDIQGAVSDASSQVKTSFAKVREQGARDAGKLGLQPGRLGYLDRITDLSQAASEASARTMAARDEKNRAEQSTWERLGQALGAHGGLPSVPSSSIGPTDASRLSAESAARATDLMRSAAGGFGQAASGYAGVGRQIAPIEAKSSGLFDIFKKTTDLADIWNDVSSIFGLPDNNI